MLPTGQPKQSQCFAHWQSIKRTKNEKIPENFCEHIFQMGWKNDWVSSAWILRAWLLSVFSLKYASWVRPSPSSCTGLGLWMTLSSFPSNKINSSSRPKNTQPWSAALFSSTPQHWTSCLTWDKPKPQWKSSSSEEADPHLGFLEMSRSQILLQAWEFHSHS